VEEILTGSAFGVASVHEEKVEKLRKRYLELRNIQDKTMKQVSEFERLKTKLDDINQ